MEDGQQRLGHEIKEEGEEKKREQHLGERSHRTRRSAILKQRRLHILGGGGGSA